MQWMNTNDGFDGDSSQVSKLFLTLFAAKFDDLIVFVLDQGVIFMIRKDIHFCLLNSIIRKFSCEKSCWLRILWIGAEIVGYDKQSVHHHQWVGKFKTLVEPFDRESRPFRQLWSVFFIVGYHCATDWWKGEGSGREVDNKFFYWSELILSSIT